MAIPEGRVKLFRMNAVALELDQRLQSLDAETAAKCERFVRDFLALVPANGSSPEKAPNPAPYRYPAFSLGLQPGIDPAKLGQLVDDIEAGMHP